MDRDEWIEENERLGRIINGGKFMKAKQGLEVGRMIAEGLAIGLNSPPKTIFKKAFDQIKE